MRKSLIVATVAVVAIAGTAVAYKAYARYDGWGHGRWHGRMSADDLTAFADARIAALKAGLALSAEQEKLWPGVEGALRDLAKKRIEHRDRARAERRDRDRDAPADPIARLRRGADRLAEVGSDLKRLADVTEPLYQSLDEAQKRRFEMLAHDGMRRLGGMHREGRGWRRHGDLGDEGRHFEPRMGSRDRIEFDGGPTTGRPEFSERL